MPKDPKHTTAARTRVLDAYRAGQDWQLVAHHNGIPVTTARRIVDSGSPALKPRGGAREGNLKCTPEIEAALVEYVEDNCLYTLTQLQTLVEMDFAVTLSTSLISQKLCGKLYTVKQVNLFTCTCIFLKVPNVLYLL